MPLEAIDPFRAHDGIDVEAQNALVIRGRAFDLYVVGKPPSEIALRPKVTKLLEAHGSRESSAARLNSADAFANVLLVPRSCVALGLLGVVNSVSAMVSDRQVRKLRKKLAEGKTVLAAADAAGMSEKSAHTWKQGPLPSEVRSNRARKWRTREDPFEGVWESELLPLLVADKEGVLEATTLLKALEEKEPDRFNAMHLRTLQRRVSEWRALHGPEREVYFEQVHVPGREGAFDFTNCNELRVTIQGALFLHLLFEFVLSFSKWRHVSLALSETFEAMVSGLQRAVWSLGGVPAVWRSDNFSAATHQLTGGGRELTRRYKAVLDHYGVRSTRIAPGKSHENGVVEKSHDVLKSQYSVPSRLIGKELEIRQHATELELRYNDQPAGTIPRIRGDKAYRIDYRHVIWSLVRKPGAFARYRGKSHVAAAIGHALVERGRTVLFTPH